MQQNRDDGAQEKNNDLENEKTELKAKIAKLEQDNSNLQIKSISSNKEIGDLQLKFDKTQTALQEQTTSCENNKIKLTKELAAAKLLSNNDDAVKILNANISSLDKEIAQNKIDKEAFQKQNSILTEKSKSEIAALNATILNNTQVLAKK